MRHIISIITLCCTALWLSAQEDIKVPLSNPGEPGTLEISLIYGSIIVDTHAGNEVIVKSTAKKDKYVSKSKKKRGLRQVAGNTMDYEIEEYNNTVSINAFSNSRAIYNITVPSNFSLKLNTINDGDIVVNGVKGDLEVSNTNGGIELNDVSGTVSADALNDDIKVTFSEVASSGTMVFSTLNGDIDLTLPGDAPVSLKMKTDMGEVYTDFEMDPFVTEPSIKKDKTKKNGYRVQVEKWITGSLNGGGTIIKCKTFNGDILIRKAE